MRLEHVVRRAPLATLIARMWDRRSKLAVAGAVVVTALVATGCGGGSSAPIVPVQGASGASGANGGTALSKSAFINQGDAICGEANAAIDALGPGADDHHPRHSPGDRAAG